MTKMQELNAKFQELLEKEQAAERELSEMNSACQKARRDLHAIQNRMNAIEKEMVVLHEEQGVPYEQTY